MATKLARCTLEVVKRYFDIIGNVYATANHVTIELKGYVFSDGKHMNTFPKGNSEVVEKALREAKPCACNYCYKVEDV